MALVTVQRKRCVHPSCHPQAEDETDGSETQEEDTRPPGEESFSECYFAVKGTALVLPHDECMHVFRRTSTNTAGDIQHHLQSMFYLLRPEDTLKMAVKLESVHIGRTRYLAVVSSIGGQNTEESCLLGIDCNHNTTIGLVLPVWADTHITLDGDGGFSMSSSGRHHIFKPVSVQAMWSALQTLHKASAKAREYIYFAGGGTHQWIQYYEQRISSDRSCLNEWHAMDDLESRRPPTPDSLRSKPTEQEATKQIIRAKLKELMMSVDLDEVTSKHIRGRLEEQMDMNLNEYKSFIDHEMITILGQMDAPTEIFEYLYLGSEWNASNLDELKCKGVGHILNVTREIDNFFPGMFDYLNIRVYDDETTEMLQHWDKTFKYITRAKNHGSKVLVHCKMGISRSASVVIAYVMKAYDWSLEKALEFVKHKRNCIKPNSGFLRQLEIYQGILDASKHRHNSLWRSKSETNLKSPEKTKQAEMEVQEEPDTEQIELPAFLTVPGTMCRPKSWSPNDVMTNVLFPPSTSSPNLRNFPDDEMPLMPASSEGGLHPRGILPRVASIKDRISELESHTQHEPHKVVIEPMQPAKPGMVLNLANQFEVVSKPTSPSPVDEGLYFTASPTKPEVEPPLGVDPVTSQTKPPVLKMQAILIKPSWPFENGSSELSPPEARSAIDPLAKEVHGFSACDIRAKDSHIHQQVISEPIDIPRRKSVSSPHVDSKTFATVRSGNNTPAKKPSQLAKEPVQQQTCAGTDTRALDEPIFWPQEQSLLDLSPCSCNSNLDIQNFKGSEACDTCLLRAQQHACTLDCFGRQVEECGYSDISTIQFGKEKWQVQRDFYEKEAIPWKHGTVQRAKQQIEEKSLKRTISFDSAFPQQTQSTPSTPPEVSHDTDAPVKSIQRSQSLRCDKRPASVAFSKKWYPLPALAADGTEPMVAGIRSPTLVDGPWHSASTPSVVEAVNQVLCGTRAVLNSAMRLFPARNAAVSFPSTVSPCVTTLHPDPKPAGDGKQEIPTLGTVRHQKEVLEGLGPQPAKATKDFQDETKLKTQLRLIKDYECSLVSNGSSQDDAGVGVVKRLTKELEAKSHSCQPKESMIIVGRDGKEAKKVSSESRPSSSTPSSPNMPRPYGHGSSTDGTSQSHSSPKRGAPPSRDETTAIRLQQLPPTPVRKTSLDSECLRRVLNAKSGTSTYGERVGCGCRFEDMSISPLCGLNGFQRDAGCYDAVECTARGLGSRSSSSIRRGAGPPAEPPIPTPTRKVRKHQGRTHPLTKLTAKQRHANPFYHTM